MAGFAAIETIGAQHNACEVPCWSRRQSLLLLVTCVQLTVTQANTISPTDYHHYLSSTGVTAKVYACCLTQTGFPPQNAGR